MVSEFNRRSRRAALAAGVAGVAFATAAWAQDPPSTPTNAPTSTAKQDQNLAQTPSVDEVVVTAQKRSERLGDVPLAVSAYTGANIQAQNITSASELREIAPSLNFNPSANSRGEGFTIRGVGTAIFSDAVEQSVGAVVDGVPLARSGQVTTELQDIDRVEVLRGPQGILFGRNASAGLVSINTRRPVLGATTFDGFFEYGSRNDVKVQGTANLPLGDTAALRVSVASTTYDGLIHDKFLGVDLNGRDEQLVRARFLWKPNEKFSAYIIADAQSSNQKSGSWTSRVAPAGTNFANLNAAQGIVPSPDNLTNAAGGAFYNKSEQKGISGQLDYDLGWAQLTSITAYRGWLSSDNNDPDILPINYLDRNSGISRLRQLTEEARISSPANERFEWLGGIFYEKIINSGAADQAGTLGVALPAGAVIGSALERITDNDTKAVFGQVLVRPIPRVKLIAAARYTDESLDASVRQFQSIGAIANIPGRYIGRTSGSTEDHNFSYRFTAQYDLRPGAMAYVTYAKGYKGPGYDTLNVTSSTLRYVAPEIPDSYEAGARFQLPWRTSVNVVGFITNFENFQAQVFDTSITPSAFRVSNAGELDTRGAEAEIETRPLAGLTLGGSFTYLDAYYGDFRNIACYAGQPVLPFGTARSSDRQCIASTAAAGAAGLTNGTGEPLVNAPKYTFNLRGRYERSIRDWRGFAQLSYYYRGRAYFSAAGDPALVEGGYGLLGGSLGIGPENGRWQVAVFARNLTDEHYATNLFSQPVLNSPGVVSQFIAPDSRRIVGVQLRVALGA